MKKLILIFLAIASLCSAAEITLTQLDASKERNRERKFTGWVSELASQARFNRLSQRQRMPLYSERSELGVRDLYIKRPKDCLFWTFGGMNRDAFIGKNQELSKQGFQLLTASKFINEQAEELYWATWIDPFYIDELMKEMKRYGLSQSSIRD